MVHGEMEIMIGGNLHQIKAGEILLLPPDAPMA
jgi:quercetin dioxygenase-like cupin family protein